MLAQIKLKTQQSSCFGQQQTSSRKCGQSSRFRLLHCSSKHIAQRLHFLLKHLGPACYRRQAEPFPSPRLALLLSLMSPVQGRMKEKQILLNTALAKLANFCQGVSTLSLSFHTAPGSLPCPAAHVLAKQRLSTVNNWNQPTYSPPGKALIRTLKPHRGNQTNAVPNNRI